VTPAAVAALVAAGVFAVGNWIAAARGARRLEFWCKPATMIALIVAACALDPAADAAARQWWFVAALVCSLAGDVLLMLDEETRPLFVPGLIAFLLAHVAYVVGFWTQGPTAVGFVIATVVVALVLVPLGYRIVTAAARADAGLRVPVASYIVVISVMVASALASGNAVAGLGAVLFAASDSMIGWNRFVRPFAAAGVAIMVTYHLGQAGLVLSLVRGS
jgi:uncharacterized membrane protein YhhN